LEKKTHKTVALLLTVLACLAGPYGAGAADAPKLSGGIAGTVRGAAGIPQMGATVVLYNHQQRQIGRVLTDDHGEFKLLGLTPAVYFIKISLASFIPATKEIMVQPGMRSVMNVNLSTLFSTIQFGYPSVESGNIMTDDWKWVLRSASSTRPILRFVDPDSTVKSPSTREHTDVFSETRGLVSLSAGEGSISSGVASEADLGTAFAVETAVNGNSLLQFAGNMGYGSVSGSPSTAFLTSYTREIGDSAPVFSVTMRQMVLPGHVTNAITSPDGGSLPMIRSISAGVDDQYKIDDNVTLQYGFTMDSVAFVNHLNYYSPYARLTYQMDENTKLEFAYSSGNGRPDSDMAADGSLQRDIAALGVFPRMSLIDGQSKIQRGQEYEIIYSHKSGSRTYSASVYRQDITNAAITMSAPAGFFAGNVLPDVFSGSSVFDAGTFQNNGCAVSATQNLGSNASVTMVYSDTGALTANPHDVVSNSPDELRSMIRAGRRQVAASRFAATVPHSGTHIVGSYQWIGVSRAAMEGNLYAADSMMPLPGMNILIRQPIPGFGRHVEANADIRNMLAQGYLPMSAIGGQRILLVQNPRSIRGGLSFTF
jgi:hypothetical protein